MWSTPRELRASITALTTVGGAPIVPDSAIPLMPSGFVLAGISTSSERNDGKSARARHTVVEKTAGYQLARRLFVNNILKQGLTNALSKAAMNLPFDNHRIDNHAEIIDGGKAIDGQRPVSGIDFHFANLTTVWVIRCAARHASIRTDPIEAQAKFHDRAGRRKERTSNITDGHMFVCADDGVGTGLEFDIGRRAPPSAPPPFPFLGQ